MSKYYNPQKVRGLYEPSLNVPFRLSRSKIDLFLECKRCFYFDRRLGVSRPAGFPFTLNAAVDSLLKKEFDIHRAKNKAHPLMEKYGIDAVPVADDKLSDWRNTFVGVQFFHKPTNFLVFGAIDDLWQNKQGHYFIVDYKATAVQEPITALDKEWHQSYKRQMEVYQWLLRQNGYNVSDTGYFVYCNGRKDKEAFDGKLEFDVVIIPYQGSNSWVDKTLFDIFKCLNQPFAPKSSPECDYCSYIASVNSKTYG